MSNRLRFTLPLLVTILLVAPLLAACGGGSSGPAAVDVTLTTYGISLSTATVKAGSVTFNVKNDATDLVHEFVVVKTDLPADQLTLDAEGNVAEDSLTVVDEIEDIEIGGGGELTVDLEAGHYVLICNVADHYKGGMHADLTVTP